MKQTLAHLPQLKQEELKLVVAKIEELVCNSLENIVLFGSYARGDWKDGPHEQGGGEKEEAGNAVWPDAPPDDSKKRGKQE